jgi:hypothetical protein
MKYLITKIKLFLLLHKKEVEMLILTLFYFLFRGFDLLDILTSCSPTPVDPGLPACLDAQKLALQDLEKKRLAKSWLSRKAQTVGSNGMEGDVGTGTVIRNGYPYTVHVGQALDKEGTVRFVTDCMRGGSIKKDC